MAKSIAAISTPRGMGGIAVIRISGDDAENIAQKVFHGKKAVCDMPSYFLQYGDILYNGQVIDKGMCVVMRAPSSFTGENVCEIHCHGGNLITQKVLDSVLLSGARLALPGEFTKRAFLNGKLDLLKAEAVGDIIHSESDSALYQAVNQLDGALSEEINIVRDKLIDTASLLAVAADYPEEDIDYEKADAIYKRLEEAHNRLSRLLSNADNGRMIKDGVLCVLSGFPNTGKSSLLNALLRKERAIVTSEPGTTRDVVEESFLYDGIKIRLADTAGIRRGESPAECIGIDMSVSYTEKADLCLIVYDGNGDISSLLDMTQNKKRIIVQNKIDLRTPTPIQNEICINISAKTGDGIEELKREIAKFAGGTLTSADKARIVNSRQKDAALKAAQSLAEAMKTINGGFPADLALCDIEDACESLGEMVGMKISDEITDRIFSKFCLGK